MKVIKIDYLTLAIVKNKELKSIETTINKNFEYDVKILDSILNGTCAPLTESTDTPNIFGRVELRQNNEIKTHYKNNYDVIYKGIKLGLLYWETYGYGNEYAHFKFFNNVLYNGEWILYKEAFKDLKLLVNHITRIDLANDSNINICKRYLKIINDTNNEIIINNTLIKDRNKLLESPYFYVRGSLDNPYQDFTINFISKDKSLKLIGYNKTNEISEHSHKTYQIKNSFKNETIYRLEVSITAKQLNREDFETSKLLEDLETNRYQEKLFDKYLRKLFRYSHPRQPRKTLL